MPTSPLSGVIQHLLADTGPDGAGVTDGQLLARFLRSRDGDALAALVRRHAPMVWGVCRRRLHNRHDAEDAFQATFLVLVRKAQDVPGPAVANWLYGVARQTAVRVRATAAKRGRREAQVANMPEPTPAEVREADLPVVLDEELSRLPDHYRGVIVVCDLEGLTRREAARQLGIPEGSVASRLARARALLAKRLARRGVLVSGPVATVLSASASASGPPALVASTIKAASVFAAGKAAAGAISVEVAALTDGVIKAMFMTKLRSAIAVVLALGVMGAGGTSLAYHMTGGHDGKQPTTAAPTTRTAAGPDGKKPGAEKPPEANKPLPKDLGKIEPPGGVPLSLVEPGTKRIGVAQLNKGRERLQSVPAKDTEQWVVELERITDVQLKDGLPSPRQACRTDFVVRMSVAFDDLRWNAAVADKLYQRARTLPTAEAKAWKNAFESVLKKEIGITPVGQDDHANLAGGPPWAVPLVLIPVDALHDGQKYSVERGKKYLARLTQLTKDDVALWRDKVDKFGGTDLDAAVNIILLDDFFGDEQFQRDRFKAAVGRQDDQKPTAAKAVNPAAKQEKDEGVVTAWGKEVGGLQAGLGLRPGGRRAYHHGETVTLVVRVRNVGTESVTFEYIRQFLDETRPAVTTADGKPVPQSGTEMMGVHGPVKVTVAPGQEIELETRMHGSSGIPYGLRPTSGPAKAPAGAWPLVVGTGTVSLQYDRVIGNSSSGRMQLDPNLSKLATGKLDLEIRSGPPPEVSMRDVMTPEEAVRQKADLDKATVEFQVEHVTKSVRVKTEGGKEAGWVTGHGPDDWCLRPQSVKEKGRAVFEAILTEKAIQQLNRAGIKDVAKHFQSKTVRVTGKMTWQHYDGLGSPPVVEVVIDDLSQLEVVD